MWMSWKVKEDSKKCPGLKKIKEAGQVDPTHHLGCSLLIKDTSQTIGKLWIRSIGWNINTELIFISGFW